MRAETSIRSRQTKKTGGHDWSSLAGQILYHATEDSRDLARSIDSPTGPQRNKRYPRHSQTLHLRQRTQTPHTAAVAATTTTATTTATITSTQASAWSALTSPRPCASRRADIWGCAPLAAMRTSLRARSSPTPTDRPAVRRCASRM